MFCKNCGKQMPDNSEFCPSCGTKTNITPQTQTPPAYQPPPAPVYAAPVQYAQPQQLVYMAPKKKKGKGLVVLLVLVLIIGAGVLSLYLFLPGLLGPKSLGIKSSPEAYNSAMVKLGITKDEAPKTGSAESYQVIYGAPHPVNTALTSEEITSFINENRPDYYALKNVQVRINDDGTVEASGSIDTAYIFEKILGGEYTEEDLKSAVPMLGMLPGSVNLYAKGTGEINNNQIENVDIQNLTVMGISIPDSALTEAGTQIIVETLEGYMERENAKNNSDIEHMAIEDGKLVVEGQFPSSVQRLPIGGAQ